MTGEGHLACGHCRNCRRGKEHVCENTIGIGVNIDGAFAEYLKLPALNVVPLDPRIPMSGLHYGSIWKCDTHCSLLPSLGEDVLVTGAGLIGSMAIAIAKYAVPGSL